MTDLRKAAEMALEALEGALSDDQPYIEKSKKAAEALRQALAQPEQEPVVGTKTWFEDGKVVTQNLYASDIYTAPPKQEWDGPTDEEYENFCSLIQREEAKLKEKNNG